MHAGNCFLLLVFAIGKDTRNNKSEENHGEDDGDYDGDAGLPGSALLTHGTTDWSVRRRN